MAGGGRPGWRTTRALAAEAVFVTAALAVGFGAMKYADSLRDDALHSPVATEACNAFADEHDRLAAGTAGRGKVTEAHVAAYDRALADLGRHLEKDLPERIHNSFLAVEGSYLYALRTSSENLGRSGQVLTPLVEEREDLVGLALRRCVELSDFSARSRQ